MWKQLGLRTCDHPASTTTGNEQQEICVHLKASNGDENDVQKTDATIHDICYRTPVKDVAPPPGVRLADLDKITISLLFRGTQKSAKRKSKRRKGVAIDMFEDTDEDNMLFSSQGKDSITESDAILAMVDAALRTCICGDAPRMNPFAEGLSVTFIGAPTSLASLAPAVFSARALQFMATRAALLPTVAHALSASVYTNARSASLRSKIESLTKAEEAQHLVPDDTDNEREGLSTASQRFERASAKLWCYLQQQIPQKHLIPKLERLHVRTSDNAHNVREEEEEDEDIFASQRKDDPEEDEDLFGDDGVDESDADDDLFAIQGSDDARVLEDFAPGFENDNLFSSPRPSRLAHAKSTHGLLTPYASLSSEPFQTMSMWLRRTVFENDLLPVEETEEDLFASLEARNPFSTPNLRSAQTRSPGTQQSPIPLSSLFSGYSDNFMLEDPDDIDDDLLLDLVLDDRISEE